MIIAIIVLSILLVLALGWGVICTIDLRESEKDVLRLSDKVTDLNRALAAQEEGEREIIQNYEQEYLTLGERVVGLTNSTDDLLEERLILFRAAERCHQTCLPNLHQQDAHELALLEMMRAMYDA